jgi:hypothetical protein
MTPPSPTGNDIGGRPLGTVLSDAEDGRRVLRPDGESRWWEKKEDDELETSSLGDAGL